MNERLLLDTTFVQALFSRNDEYHGKAKELLPRLRTASLVFITEAVILEIGNALREVKHRKAAVGFINSCYEPSEINFSVVPMTTELLKRSLKLFEDRQDKEWSMTDCISFVAMEENKIEDAVTADHHFRQAKYRALMLEK